MTSVESKFLSPPGNPRASNTGLSRLPPAMQSVRFRLTLLYSLMLFGVASIMMGGIYWGLSSSLTTQIVAAEMASDSTGPTFDIEQDRYDIQEELELLVDERTLETLRRYSIFGLGAIFFASFGVGWFTAGRVLMPIGRITRVARDIQATDLSRRIGLAGPNDDLKQLADTFDAMLDRLQRAFDNQQQLIHDTSHELRNPLAVMRTNLDVTLSDPDASLEQYQHTTEVVRRSSERMSKLVDDLLAYARHEATTRVEAPVDLTQLVVMLVDEFQGAAEQEGLHLNVDVEPELWVLGHARSLEQAIANLLANAVRFAPTGSGISIGAGQKSGWIWLTVSDHGPGVDEDERDRVFQRYVRLGEGEVGRPHLAGGQGSGLGLAIVREILQTHRGEVSIIDTEVGATFAMWMPVHVDFEVTSEFRIRRPKRKVPPAPNV
ncbi:MAG: HAMP domain-containing sensor histidine kinase [Acidimicrobiales bacterium]